MTFPVHAATLRGECAGDNDEKFSSVDLPGSVYKAKKRQVIAIVLITNKLTYANEANASRDPKGRERKEEF